MKKIIYFILALAFFSGIFLRDFFREPALVTRFETPFALPFPMPEIPTVQIPDRICDITDYGAFSNGTTSNTQVFAKAIADCAQKGGGKVNVPSGTWLTGPIHLKSNIELHLEKGAFIKFDPNLEKYLPEVFSRFEGIEYFNYSPLIYARNVENIALTGEGTLDGQDESWKKDDLLRQMSVEKLYESVENNISVEKRRFGNKNFLIQPSFVQFINSKNILIDGVTIKNSPNWTVHPIYSENITISNVTIDNNGRNSDGIAIDSSRNVLIKDCQIESGDDAIVIKSGRDQDGLRVNKSSENIIIRDCKIEEGHSGIAIGSEMSGGIRNVYVHEIDMNYVKYGFRMKSAPSRGGIVEKIWLDDVRVDRAITDAIRLDLLYQGKEESYDKDSLPIFKDIHIKDFYCRRAKNAIILIGLPESPLRNISFENVHISATQGITKENVQNEKLEDLNIKIN